MYLYAHKCCQDEAAEKVVVNKKLLGQWVCLVPCL